MEKQIKMKTTYINEPNTDEIVDIETSRTLETFRLKAAASEGLLRYSKEQRTKIKIVKVK